MTRTRQPRDPRVLARCEVEFDQVDRRIVAESEDLSRRGVFVRTDELLPVGHETGILVRRPDGAVFEVTARVVHSDAIGGAPWAATAA
ncbi:MAG: PilZ domain-containing protein [Kofleriaceae bacterium]